MAEGVTSAVSQCNMPNGRSIYELITSNNLAEIRAHLNPLTLYHRKSIVSQKVRKKPLLGHACELGFRDIVTYLLDECEADISVRYLQGYFYLTPLRVAIRNQDVSMLRLLISRGALTADKHDARFCIKYASGKNCPSIAWFLRNNTAKIPPRCISEHPNVITWATNMHLQNTEPFLIASASGDVGRMKALMADGVDPKVTNPTAENALCIAILNKKSNAEHFLLNYRVFSLWDHVQALELAGAKVIAFQSECNKGLRFWRKALRIRTENFLGVSDKMPNIFHADMGLEFTCEEQLKLLTDKDANIYVQALIVLLRLLTSFSQVVHIAFVIVAQHPVIQQDLSRAMKILAKLALLPDIPDSGWGSPVTTAIDAMETLFRGHFMGDRASVDDSLTKLRFLIDFINDVNWKGLLYLRETFHRVVYIQLLKRLLHNLISLNDSDICILDQDWIKDGISSILKHHPDPYPTTLLHLAIEEQTALPVIPFLLGCSDDVNCADNRKNTPMHKVALLAADSTLVLHLVNLLADAGGHIDAANCFNKTPLKRLVSEDVITNPLKYLSLQCLAAQTVYKNKLSVPQKYPKMLASFIKLHSP